jgi:hypothetical protein
MQDKEIKSIDMGIEGDDVPLTRKTGRRESQRGLPLHLGQRKALLGVCGHQVMATSQPSSSCFDCWHRYFSVNAKLVFGTFEFLRAGKDDEIKAARGTKFLKQFKKFVSHVQSLAPIEPSDAVSAEVS